MDGGTSDTAAQPRTLIWTKNFKHDVLKQEIVKGCQQLSDDTHYGDIMSVLHKACEIALPRMHPSCRSRKPKY